MSLEASDVQTDEDCEELVSVWLCSGSPYLSSMNMNPRRAAVAAWRLPRASLGDTRGDTPGESGSARLTSLSNGHDASQALRSECDVTPELLKQTLSMRKHKHLHSGSNGFTFSSGDHREKEDMYDEIMRLKKSLQAQKSDNHQMKAKLRRLEEDNTKREKQIEELLDPTKVLNGLKQRILKLEQQCREKENALSKLQSELRTTNLEELKITVETYYEELQRLRLLLEAAEKSSRAESKCSQRQQKALSSTVHRLSENLKQRLEDSRRHAQSAKSSGRLDQEVQATPTEGPGFTMATEAVVSVGTITEEGEKGFDLRERFSQLEKERAELQDTLSSKDDELRQLRTEREELEKDTEQWKAEQTKEWDKERQQHKYALPVIQKLDELLARIQTLEDKSKSAQAELSSLSATSPKDNEDTHEAEAGLEEEEERDARGKEEKGDEESGREAGKKEREKAALVIQTNWREHRNRDIVMLQSALRGHLLRESQLKDLLKDTQNKTAEATNRSDVASSVEGEPDVVALTMIQSVFRGHLARCSLAIERNLCAFSNGKQFAYAGTKKRALRTHKQQNRVPISSAPDSFDSLLSKTDEDTQKPCGPVMSLPHTTP
ncbi:IQ domain-containing protein E [Collichthys lucidus]|uniref:IQ domain-containing protein E n=1 Tax=Collichthys lucidus TaxID=240159 RepID=A0A4V6AMH0_COLLU|nr:IQ domain-containing protein E [Collichthys lucidus]